MTTLILSLVNAGVLSGAGDVKMVIGLAVFYGGLAQLLAGMWEFRAGNTFGATAFSSYGAFWLSFAVLFIPGFGVGFGTTSGPSATGALGYYLIAWAIFTGFMTIGALQTNGATASVFILLTITYILLAIGAWGGQGFGKGLTAVGGWVGILTAIAAWYTAAAGVLTAVSGGRINLPVYSLAR
jgi:succinate-acetate transporter protein